MPILLIVIKASLLLAAALAGARLLRAAPAVTRHTLWSVTFAALLALPGLGAAVPAIPVAMPAAWAADAVAPVPAPPSGAPVATRAGALVAVSNGAVPGRHELASPSETRSTFVPPSRSLSVPAMPSIGATARGIWLAGAAAAAGALLLSLLRVRRLAAAAVDVADPAWHDAVRAIGTRLGLRRPARVVVSNAVRTPMAGGVWRPVIFLPADAPSWSAERRDVVLAHELAHIARRDPLRHLAARVAVACYWFHPLAWLAARQSSLAREQACDEAVLALGIRPSDYARVLLDLAETMTPSRQTAVALPMVERSLLETRLMAILDPQTRPSRLRRPFVAGTCAALVTLALASVQPLARGVDIQSPAVSPAAPSSAPAAQAHDAACWTAADIGDDFHGYSDTDSRGTVIERVGATGTRRIIQRRFDTLRVCVLTQDPSIDRGDRPSAWAGFAERVIVETAGESSTARLEIRRAAGAVKTTWRVNGADRPFDAAAQAWRDAVLAVADGSWEISTLRGEESSLRGDISSLRGDESSLRGDISSIHGDISSLRGDISSIRGDESSLRGDISSIEGQLSSLQGDISSERGAISSLESERYSLGDRDRASVARQIDKHRAAIARIEREIAAYDANSKIAAVEKQLRDLNADAKVAAVEDRIRSYGEAGKVAAIEKQIEALNVAGKTAEIERRISALDADSRTRQIQGRLEEAIKRLERALGTIK